MRNSAGLTQGKNTFKAVRLGAGGLTTGISMSNDGVTKAARIDVFGGYIKSTGDAVWRQAFTSATLAAADCPGGVGYTAANANFTDGSAGAGCFELVVAPNDNQRLYAVWNARLWKSVNAGQNWTHLTAMADFLAFANSGPQPHNLGANMAVDPQNHDVFLLGTQNNGLNYSTNGGTTITNVALGTNGTFGGWQMPSKVACDPTGTVTSTVKQRWFAVLQGTGIYVSTTGPGGTYTLMTGSPIWVTDLTFDAAGNCWAIDPSNTSTMNLWKCAAGGTTWAVATDGGLHSLTTVATDPLNANRIVTSNQAFFIVSSNGGTSWLGSNIYYATTSGHPSISEYAQTLPWLGISPWGGNGIQCNGTKLLFDSAVSNKLWFGTGTGIQTCQAPTAFGVITNGLIDPASRFDWQECAEGIEDMVATTVVEQSGGVPLFGVWDQGAWRMNSLDQSPRVPNRAPAGAFGPGVEACWDIAIASDNPNYVAALINFNGEWSGYSTDGWQTVNAFATTPIGTNSGGCICVGPQNNILIAQTNDRPYYTKDGGSTWTYVNVPGMPTSGTGFGTFANYFVRKIACYDALAGKYYMANYGASGWTAGAGIWSTSDLAGVWTQTHVGTIWGLQDAYHAKLRWVPGHQGCFYFCAGFDQTVPLKYSNDGCVTFTNVPNVTQVTDFAFGVAAPGQSYPAIYFYGWLSGVRGLYRSDDNFATTPKLLTAYPGNICDQVQCVGASPNIYGRVYVGFSGSGFVYGNYDCPITLS